MYIIATWLQA